LAVKCRRNKYIYIYISTRFSIRASFIRSHPPFYGTTFYAIERAPAVVISPRACFPVAKSRVGFSSLKTRMDGVHTHTHIYMYTERVYRPAPRDYYYVFPGRTTAGGRVDAPPYTYVHTYISKRFVTSGSGNKYYRTQRYRVIPNNVFVIILICARFEYQTRGRRSDVITGRVGETFLVIIVNFKTFRCFHISAAFVSYHDRLITLVIDSKSLLLSIRLSLRNIVACYINTIIIYRNNNY